MHSKVILCILLSLYTTLCTCQYLEEFVPKSGGVPNSNEIYYEIPFEYPGAIILKVTAGNEIYDFAFDTGGYTMITDALQGQCCYPVLKQEVLSSANGLKKEVDVVVADGLNVGGFAINPTPAYQVNFDNSPTTQCLINGGFIGGDIIKNYIWQIDYPNKKIIVTTNRDRLKSLDKAIKVPVYLNSHAQPYFMARVNGHSQWFMFDTGCSSLLWMDPKDVDKHIDRATDCTMILGGTVETHHGRVKDTVNVFKANFEAGGIQLANRPVFYSQDSGLTLFGSPIIKEYIITLNFAEGEMYFEPIAGAHAKEGWEGFGITLEYDAGKVTVASLVEGSLAQRSGLLVNDEVTAINNKKITCTDYCDCRETFQDLLEKSTEVLLTVQKNRAPKNFNLKKENFFKI